MLKHMTKYCTHLGDHPTSFSQSNLPFDPELIPNLSKHGSSGVEEFLARLSHLSGGGTVEGVPSLNFREKKQISWGDTCDDRRQPLLRVGQLN